MIRPETRHSLPHARCLNVSDAAEYLGCTIWFVRTLAWNNKIKSIKMGARLLFPREELDAYVDRAKGGAE